MIYKSFIIEKNIDKLDKKIYLFYGENNGLKNDFKNKIKQFYKGYEVLNFYQEDILKDETIIFKEISNFSLFEDNKIIFISNTSDKLLNLLEKIINLKIDSKVFLFAGQLEKKSKIRNYFEKSEKSGVIACYADTAITIKNIITKILKGYEGLTPHNINLICENSNYNRTKLYNEMKKIITYFINKKITTEELEKILDAKINEDFSILRDEALLGNKNSTNRLLSDTVIDDDSIIYYLNSVNLRLNKLFEVNKSSNGNIELAVDTLKPTVFWKDKPKLISQAKIWDSQKLKNILKLSYSLEKRFKTNSTVNKKILFKKLMVDICEAANI